MMGKFRAVVRAKCGQLMQVMPPTDFFTACHLANGMLAMNLRAEVLPETKSLARRYAELQAKGCGVLVTMTTDVVKLEPIDPSQISGVPLLDVAPPGCVQQPFFDQLKAHLQKKIAEAFGVPQGKAGGQS